MRAEALRGVPPARARNCVGAAEGRASARGGADRPWPARAVSGGRNGAPPGVRGRRGEVRVARLNPLHPDNGNSPGSAAWHALSASHGVPRALDFAHNGEVDAGYAGAWNTAIAAGGGNSAARGDAAKGGSHESATGFISDKHELPESARYGLSFHPEDPGIPANPGYRVDRREGPGPDRGHGPAPGQVRPLRGARRRRPGPGPVQHRRDGADRQDRLLRAPAGHPADGVRRLGAEPDLAGC